MAEKAGTRLSFGDYPCPQGEFCIQTVSQAMDAFISSLKIASCETDSADDLDAADIPRAYLGRLVRRSLLVQTGRGLYAPAGVRVTEHRSLAEVARRVPKAVISLLSALHFHGLLPEAPPEVWITLPRNAWRPWTAGSVPLRVQRSRSRCSGGTSRSRSSRG